MIHDRVEMARRGENPFVISRVESGRVVVGDVQFLPGYCLLLPDPVVPSLNDLTPEDRATFLLDMTALGEVLLEVTGAYRINYDILGNSEPALHAHVVPRYETETENMKRKSWMYYDQKTAPKFDPERDASLVFGISDALARRQADAR